LGLPEKFHAWRQHQTSAIWAIEDSEKPIVGICAPTGFGKTSMYLGHAALMGERVCVVTGTKILQDQLISDFGGLVVDIRGQGNYTCSYMPVTVAEAPCHLGMKCEKKTGGCPYFDQRARAKTAKWVVTNYQYFLYAMQNPEESIGTFDRVIFDEAHNAFEQLGQYLSVWVGSWEIGNLLNGIAPKGDAWPEWARHHVKALRDRLEKMQERGAWTVDRDRVLAHRIRGLANKLERLAMSDPTSWVMTQERGNFNWECVWPGAYRNFLFRGGKSYLLTSATLTRKTLELLGLGEDEYEFHEYPSEFPLDRRPVYYWPVVRLSQKNSPEEILYWMHAIGRWVEARSKRKGIVQTVSYDRAKLLKANSKHPEWFILSNDSGEMPRRLEEFREAEAPKVFASPSLIEGVDLPGKECEYVVIAKVPFPPPSPLLKARGDRDPEYMPHLVMQKIVQGAGRGMRHKLDRCETLIPDGMFGWFFKSWNHLAPAYFLDAVSVVDAMPKPAPRLP
jgi:Rad3-related DNA helicase